MRALSFLLFLLLPSVASASVLVVHPTLGPYTQIQSAVDAAVDGDVILVKSGQYASFVVRNQDVAIVADAGANVGVTGAIRISGVSATRTVLLSGLVATGVPVPTGNRVTIHGLYARNSAGLVFVQDCRLTGGIQANLCGSHADGARIENCQAVVLSRCTLTGASQNLSAPPTYSSLCGVGLTAVGSSVAVYDSTIQGGTGPDCGWVDCSYGYGYTGCAAPCDGGHGGPGVELTNCTLFFASKSVLAGGSGGDGSTYGTCIGTCGTGGDGGNGLHNQGGVSPRCLDVTASAGQGGTGGFLGGFGHCPNGTTGAPFGGVPGTQLLPQTGRRLHGSTVAREGSSASVVYSGLSGDTLELLSTDAGGFEHLVQVNGVLVPRQRRPGLVLQGGTLPAGGTLSAQWVVPELGPGVQARVRWMQAVHRAPGGAGVLGTPHVVVLLDSAF